MEDFVHVQLREDAFIGVFDVHGRQEAGIYVPAVGQYPGRPLILCGEQQGGEGGHCPGLPSHSEGHAGYER